MTLFLSFFNLSESQSPEKRAIRSFRGETLPSEQELPKHLNDLVSESLENKNTEDPFDFDQNSVQEIDAVLTSAFAEENDQEDTWIIDPESIDNDDILDGEVFNGLFDHNLSVRQMECETEEVCQIITIPRVGEKRVCKKVSVCNPNAEEDFENDFAEAVLHPSL